MTNIFEVWEYINFITDKYRNGFLSLPEVSKALDVAQNMLHGAYMGKRQNGNELSLPALRPFYTTISVVSDTNGLALYPNLWAKTQGIYVGSTSFRQILHDELQQALSSVMYPIAENPRYLEHQTGAQLYPNVSTTISWHYISRPTTPAIGFTNVGNQVIYDPTTSVQLQFSPEYWNQIIALALPYIGCNLSDQEVAALVSTYNLNARVGDDGN